MLKVDINSLLINKKSITVNSEAIRDLIGKLSTIYGGLYSKVKARTSLDIDSLNSKVSKELDSKIEFLTKIVVELEEAMGESVDQLIEHKYSDDIYEDKIIAFYTDHWYKLDKNLETQEEAYSHFYVLDNLYDFWHTGQGMDKKVKLYLELREFQDEFNYDRFGLDVDEVRKELLYIYEKRGSDEMELIMHALLYNCPDNFEEYNFNPTEMQPPYEGRYALDPSLYGTYKLNVEKITIHGIEFEYVQTLPSDCTGIEALANNFTKARMCNTLRSLPKSFLRCVTAKCNTIVSTHDDDISLYKNSSAAEWYNPNQGSAFDSCIILKGYSALRDVEWYTKNAFIHELGHKFDDTLADLLGTKIPWNWSAVDKVKWEDFYTRYKNITQAMTESGYNPPPDVGEFFAEVICSYFIAPDELQGLAPDLYDEISALLGGDYGKSFNKNNEEIEQGRGNKGELEVPQEEYPEPQPGPGPMPEPTPPPTQNTIIDLFKNEEQQIPKKFKYINEPKTESRMPD